MGEQQTVDVENLNKLLARFQSRIGELEATKIVLENEIDRLATELSRVLGELETYKNDEPAEATTDGQLFAVTD